MSEWEVVGPKLLALVEEMQQMLHGPGYLVREQVVIASLRMGDSWPERAAAAIKEAKLGGAS